MVMKTEITERLRTFADEHPDGWNHDQWLGLLAELHQGGAADANAEELGKQLEAMRLAGQLKRSGVAGLGPKRIDALVSRFGTVWSLKQASVEAVAETPRIPRTLAEEVLRAVE